MDGVRLKKEGEERGVKEEEKRVGGEVGGRGEGVKEERTGLEEERRERWRRRRGEG